jgi:hypothetical protein
MLIKVDIAETFDSVVWPFLLPAAHRFLKALDKLDLNPTINT